MPTLEMNKGFNIDDAWKIHKTIRENSNNHALQIAKTDLQRKLEVYRQSVKSDFRIDLTELEQPKDFLTKRSFANRLSEVDPRQWYSSLERMRSYELKKHFEDCLKDQALPEHSDRKLVITDVGSRSNFFGSLMKISQPEHDWQMVDVAEHKLPAKAMAKGHYRTIEPFGELPKSDVITLNCVLHHVGEIGGDKPQQFDDSKVENFIKTVYDALPEDGLVVAVEDYIGKDTIQEPYKYFIKGVDHLFYPQALGNQKPSKQWIELFEKKGFSLAKQTYPVGFNVVGFPVVETCLVFRKKHISGDACT